jgi:hypothetical protein
MGKAYEIHMRAKRWAAELYDASEKAKGARGNSSNQYQKEVRPADAGAPKPLAVRVCRRARE